MGAISAAITACIADLTRERHRTKAMAMVGGSIGLTFALSLVIASPLLHSIGMHGIFALMSVLGVVAIGVTLFVVPSPPPPHPVRLPFRSVLLNADRRASTSACWPCTRARWRCSWWCRPC